MSTETQQSTDGSAVATSAGTLTVTDNRTGQQYQIPIEDNTIRATELRKIKTSDDDFGLMTYDPAYMATASCRSAITFLDGEAGILEYRGYPIEQLAEKSSYLEVAYLLIHGELPTQKQLADWDHLITIHTFVHENVKEFMQGFRYDAHPMGMLLASVGALSTFYPEAAAIKDAEARYIQVIRLLAKMPTLAAFAYRHNRGMPYVYPDNDLSYAGNFLGMLFKIAELKYQPDPRIERTENIPSCIEGVKAGEERLMGFGHRVYKNYDPRAKIIKSAANDVFEVTGTNPLLDIALELERIALDDKYFVNS